MSRGVVVVGSANLDIVVELDRTPRAGETVFGRRYSESPGGKGGNQAVAAARVAETAFVAVLGGDSAGLVIADNLIARGVDTADVVRSEQPSGRAFITVTPDGENSIVVLPLANAGLTAQTVLDALQRRDPAVVLAQRESPDSAVLAAVGWCTEAGARFVLNASPVAPVPAELLAATDPLIVNEEEARGILNLDEGDEPDAAELARRLDGLSPSAVVTAGKDGSFVATAGTVTHVAAESVRPVDTTGAGDEFAGRLAAELAGGSSLVEAARRATAASARLIQLPRGER